jgi:OmpA-OmpF porin, OOP family
MKKNVILIIVIMLMAIVTAAQAEVTAGSVSVTPFGGVYVFEGNQDLKTSAVYGLRVGYNFTNHLGVEGFFSYTQTEIQDESQWKPWQDICNYGIEGLYHFMPEGRFVPFIAIGLGGINYSEGKTYTYNPYYGPKPYGDRFKSDQFAVDYGAGLKFFLTDNIALRADVRHVLPLNGNYNNPDYVHNDFIATLGINFAFGGEKKAVAAKAEEPPPPLPVKVEEPPPPPPVDSDKDGVPDNLDKCPCTPAGVTVDKDGCPLDSDKDGVPDYLDKCPGTPAGVAVDNDGCPVKEEVVAKPVIIEKGRQTLNVKFDFDKSTIKKGYYKDINDLAKVMKNYPDLKVIIKGYADSVGDPAYNKKLSRKRADAIKKYMVKKAGINANRIAAKGFGAEKPVASNVTEKGRLKNRRVEAAVDYLIKK